MIEAGFDIGSPSSDSDSIMSARAPSPHPVTLRRKACGWSQEELAARSGTPRSSISAIEAGRLTPSVTAALAVAKALGCSVEELFGEGGLVPRSDVPQWAGTPGGELCRFWEAEVGGQRWLYPVESLSVNPQPHDGIWKQGVAHGSHAQAEDTLVLACCDPAAGLLANEYARESGFRLIVLQRGGDAALTMLKQGMVHIAGVHRSTHDDPERNAATVRDKLGAGYRLVRAAEWQEVLALPNDERASSLSTIMRKADTWALREPGSAARECLDELLGKRHAEGRIVSSHNAVATAVHDGWADAGVCVQLSAEEAGLRFMPVRIESLDLCFADRDAHDPRMQALLRVLRSRSHRKLIAELPGYDARHTGELISL